MRSPLILLPMVALAALAACSKPETRPGPPPPAAKPLTISYETSPCFGFCPVYRVTVSADGKGSFTGIRNTAVTGDRDFTVSPAQFDAFAKALAPYRPSGTKRIVPGEPDCKMAATDLPGVKIGWSGTGPDSNLDFYYGCDMQANRVMATALGNAPDTLPIESLIGDQP